MIQPIYSMPEGPLRDTLMVLMAQEDWCEVRSLVRDSKFGSLFKYIICRKTKEQRTRDWIEMVRGRELRW